MNGNNSSTPSTEPSRPLPEETLISVILPVYNEAKVLPILAARIAEELIDEGVQYEIIFINDGSSDESAIVLDELAMTSHRVRVLHLSRNFGHQSAVQAGLAYAQGDAVILMDSDLQDAPEAIPRFLHEWRIGYDVVYALRTRRKENAVKRFLFTAFHRIMSAVASVPIPADAGIFGLIDRRVAQHILAFGEIDRYYPGLRSWVGFEQKGIEVERNARYDEKPRVSLSGLFHLATTAMFSFSSFPLMIFHVIGAMAGIVFIALGGFAIFCRLFTDYAIPGWTSHILTGSFFGALNALGISILGEYVTRIYDQVRGRPQYIVDRTSNIHRERVPESILREFDDIPDDEDAAYLDLMEEASELLREGTILNSNRDSKMNFNTSNTNSNAPINFDATAEPSMVVPFDDGY